ncbi:hypothetical protein BDM02DRAFT_3253332 [Thelephora ganbajun]|uniref:Uncharacterized protein n=1 Tax=Thelephora ganbajun TaxID=370292 RepID=A0ACB6YXD7_THEGA|nr:hypothetical protein BDM02DRAFT_3253332 [Thelephora ganbajun]
MDVVTELAQSDPFPSLDVMQVVYHYFKNSITYFTHRIDKIISMGIANREVASFVGHNTFLCRSALRMHPLLMKPTGSGRFDQSHTYLRISTWLSVFSSRTTPSDGRFALMEASRRVLA